MEECWYKMLLLHHEDRTPSIRSRNPTTSHYIARKIKKEELMMLHALALPFLLLQLTVKALAGPVAASSLNVSPGDTILADASVASR